jgi:hypothetical protein
MLLWTNHARDIWDIIQLVDNHHLAEWCSSLLIVCLKVRNSSPLNVQMKYTCYISGEMLVSLLKFNLYSVNSRSNNLRFGSALAEICQQTYGFVQRQCQEGTTGPKSDTQSIHNMVTSLIGPTSRKWNGPAVVSLVCWLQTLSVLAWLWLKSANKLMVLSSDSAKRAWQVQNQTHRAFITW